MAHAMAAPLAPLWPIRTSVLDNDTSTTDPLPATYHYHDTRGKHAVSDPEKDISVFLRRELSLGGLTRMLRHLWFAGAERPAVPLHHHATIGREIAVDDRMDVHLLWTNKGKLFIKPILRFLLDPSFCQTNLCRPCPSDCVCDNLGDTCQQTPRKVALGFLYTYACLISSESDFHVANENRLLPRNKDDKPITWTSWKTLARELLRVYEHDRETIHPRFRRAELRLSRINTIHRFTNLPRFDPYLRIWYNYGSLFGVSVTWMATIAVFVALVLTAMQVGLATEQLKDNAAFHRASYGFTVFAILGPMCAFGLVVVNALLHLIKDLSLLLGRQPTRRERHHTVFNNGLGTAA